MGNSRTRLLPIVGCILVLQQSWVTAFGFQSAVAADNTRDYVSFFGLVGETTTSQATQRMKTALALAPQQLGSFEELEKEQGEAILYDWSDGDPIPFTEMWNFQKELVQRQLDRLSSVKDSEDMQKDDGKLDSIIMLQHKPVYTLGTASDPNFITQQNERVDVVRMDRGGEVTYHGPGQLVVYPILDLRGYKQDIHWYMRALEEAVLLALDNAGVNGAIREDDVTGVWVENQKVAAIGIRARRWVTMHGLAVNVEQSSLSNFDGIVPCGLEGRAVTCVNRHLNEPILVGEFAIHMKAALEQVFRVRLVPATDSKHFDEKLLVQVAQDGS